MGKENKVTRTRTDSLLKFNMPLSANGSSVLMVEEA